MTQHTTERPAPDFARIERRVAALLHEDAGQRGLVLAAEGEPVTPASEKFLKVVKALSTALDILNNAVRIIQPRVVGGIEDPQKKKVASEIFYACREALGDLADATDHAVTAVTKGTELPVDLPQIQISRHPGKPTEEEDPSAQMSELKRIWTLIYNTLAAAAQVVPSGTGYVNKFLFALATLLRTGNDVVLVIDWFDSGGKTEWPEHKDADA